MKTINITWEYHDDYGVGTVHTDSQAERKADSLYRDYLRNYAKRLSRGERYRKYMVLEVNDIHTVTKTKVVSEQPGQPIISHMVRLGGPFEEVGGTDEVIGREDQRLGSDNK